MRLAELKEIVSEQVVDVTDLVYQLEITIEDVLERFGDKLREHQAKFGVTSVGFSEDADQQEDDEA